MTAPAPALAGDLESGLRRLRLGAMRRLAPELLVTAKTQRWSPEEFLRTLIGAEIASRDASNALARLKSAGFPVTKTIDEFDLAASSIKPATFNYLTSLEWITARENVCLVGPAGTGKSHLLVALGHAAVDTGERVRYFTAAELVETLYRGLADNSVGRVIENILRADLILIDEIGFAPLDDTGAQLFFRLVAGAYEQRSLGIASPPRWGQIRPSFSEWIDRPENLVVCGPSGTGKPHLLEALGHAAIGHGCHVQWFSLEALGALVHRHRADGTTSRAIRKLMRADLICVDDLGLLPVSSDTAEALYRVVDAAYEKRSIALSSNLHPAGFDELMPKTIANATVDRLMHHAHVVITTGDSIRLTQATRGKGVRPLGN